MHLEGRKKVFVDSESERSSLEKELNLLKMSSLTEGTLPSTGPSTETCTLGPALPLALQEAQQKLDWALKSESIAMSMLNTCTDERKKSSEKADFSILMLAAKRNRVEELGVQILCVEQQLKMMTMGAGFSFYPQPVISNPDFVDPFTVIHITNCLVCGNGFEFKDILVASCGHTYHLICLHWHSKTSLSCKLASCLKPFTADWLLSVGIRPLSKLASVSAVTMDQSRRTTWMQKLLQRCSQVLPLPGTHEEEPPTHVKEGSGCNVSTSSQVLPLPGTHEEKRPTHVKKGSGFDVGNMENLNEAGWSVHASNLGSDSNVISPETNFVSLSYNGPAESVNVNNDTRTCLVCCINTPYIKFKDCGHSRVCEPCVMQHQTKVCPVCCLEVTGFVRRNVGDVSSPLRPVQESTVTLRQNSVHGKPSPPFKLDLNAAFNVEIVPQIGNKDEKKEVVSNGYDVDDSDDEDWMNPTLVHYPPLPVIGKSAKQPLSGEALTLAESELEGEEGEWVGLVSMGLSDLTKEGDAGLCMDKQEVQPNVKSSKATKKQQVPAIPSLSCGKRVTRADIVDIEKKPVVKKRRRKKASPAVKAFNSFS